MYQSPAPMPYNAMVMASRPPTLTLMVFILVLAGCGTLNPEADECGNGASCARKAPRTEQHPPPREPTVYPKQVLTGTITDRGKGLYLFRKQPGSWILAEENPNADCRGDKGPLKPGCEKMYFDITKTTDVYQEQANSLAKVSAIRLEEGQKVRVDYTGYSVAMSYPSQTDAREVVILDTN